MTDLDLAQYTLPVLAGIALTATVGGIAYIAKRRLDRLCEEAVDMVKSEPNYRQ